MTITADDLRPQIVAALATFEKMSAKERETQVSKYYGERVNELINLSKQAIPDVVESRWPKSIPIRTAMTSMGGSGEATYSDIRAILAELGAILAEGITYC